MPSPDSDTPWISQHRDAVLAFIRLNAGPLLLEHESPSDLVQEVFLELVSEQSRFDFRGDGALRRWLYTTALRKIQDRQRYFTRAKRDVRRQRSLPPLSDNVAAMFRRVLTPSEDAVAREEIARIEQCFASLSDVERRIITLVQFAGFDYAMLGETIGTTPDAARMRFYRALARLSVLLAEG